MEALLAVCHEGRPPPEEQIQQLWELVQQAEPDIQPYLKECVCCFAVGAYSAAIVMAWCAIARYLYLAVEAVGVEVAQILYRDERGTASQPLLEMIRQGDRPLYIAYRSMRLVEDSFIDHLYKIEGLYKQRCQYAHPTGEKAECQEAFDYVTEARWLLSRRIGQERFQNIAVVMQCAAEPAFNLKGEARKLVLRVRCNQRESLAVTLLNDLLSEEKSKNMPYERALVLWNEVTSLLSEDARRRLMEKLAFGLAQDGIDQFIDAIDVVQDLLFWTEAQEQRSIWEYVVARRDYLHDYLGEVYKRLIRQYAPFPYRAQFDEPLEPGEAEI